MIEYKDTQEVNIHCENIIKYGIRDNYIDVTYIALEKCVYNNRIIIPSNDHKRAELFGDPVPFTLKSIFIDNTDGEYNKNKLYKIQNNLKLNYGSFNDEYPEQLNVITYLSGDEKVLEIGGNIGRVSLIIASILKDSRNLVTLECDKKTAKLLEINRDINGFKFYIEDKALSKRKLYQKEWDTSLSIYNNNKCNVENISYALLKSKYNIVFDTLVLDCEGAFYYILMDMPEILNNIKLIIMENDYNDITHKNYIDEQLIKHGFYNEYREAGGWGVCYNNFFEVWKKK
jgi:FkbM family methyltransferase